MKRGRPTTPLAQRISAKIVGNPDVTLPSDACWIWQPKHPVMREGMVTRLLFGIRYGEPLHDSCRPVNKCGFRKCVNPDHHMLRPHNAERWGGMIMPRALREITPPSDEEEIEELMRVIESNDYASPEELRAAQLAKSPPTDWALHHIQEAWRRLGR